MHCRKNTYKAKKQIPRLSQVMAKLQNELETNDFEDTAHNVNIHAAFGFI
jgi:hypothetical protein